MGDPDFSFMLSYYLYIVKPNTGVKYDTGYSPLRASAFSYSSMALSVMPCFA